MRLTRTTVLLSLCLTLAGCRAPYIETTVSNRTPTPNTHIEVDYPSASFGTQSLAPGADFHYRFSVIGSGPLKLLYTDAIGKSQSSIGPTVSEGAKGPLIILTATPPIRSNGNQTPTLKTIPTPGTVSTQPDTINSPYMSRGYFITFEGLDGSGKTTQLRRLATSLQAEGHTVTTLRNPGGTPLGDQIRSIILDSRTDDTHGPMTPLTELALMFADRAQSIAEIVLPALAAGHIVLCDRFTDSSEAYQGGGRQLGALSASLAPTARPLR